MSQSLDIYKGKRILLTGHTGFKGAWLALWLHELGAEVIGYALEPPTTPNLFEISGLETVIRSVHGDVRNLASVQRVCEQYQPEIVFHLAAQPLVRRSYKEPVLTYATNVMGTTHVLEACRDLSSAKAIVVVTSDKCYDNREWVWGYREIDPMGGDDPYSSSKGCAELITKAYVHSFFHPERYKKHGIAIATVRAGNVIGGGDWAEDRLVPDCIRAFMRNEMITIRYPDAVRPWQHVLEPLYGYLLLAQRLYKDGPLFEGGWNFGPADEDIQAVRRIVENIATLWGEQASWKQTQARSLHETRSLKLDCSKAKTKLGWYPQWDLQTTLTQTVYWYKAYSQHEDMLRLTINQIRSYAKQRASM